MTRKARTAVKTTASQDPRTSAPNTTAAAPKAPPPITTPGEGTHVSPDGGAADKAKLPTRKKSDMVSVTVPVAFNLTLDSGDRVRYEAGIQDMPRDHAEHFYATANGVEKNED